MNKIESKFNKSQIYLSAGSHFITDIYQSFIIGLIPVLTLKFELSLFKVGLLTATSIIANSLTSPVFGYFSDRHGLKYYIIAGPLFTSIFLSMLGILPNYYFVLIFLFLGNLSIAAYHPASAAVAGHYGGDRKGFGSSIINFGGNFGNSLGSLIIILIMEKIGPKFTPFAMIPGIIMAIVLFKLVPRTQINYRTESNLNLFSKIKNVDRRKIFLLFLIMLTVYSLYIILITLITYMPLYYTESNISLINIGIILLFFGMLGGAGGLFSGYFFDKLKKGSFIIQIGLIVSIPMIYFIFKTSGIISIILFIASGFFLISIQPVCIRLSQDLLPGNISLASSFILGFSPGLAAITMIFLGKLADNIGIVKLINYELILLILTFLLLTIFPVIGKRYRI